jgi:hypothetical protein
LPPTRTPKGRAFTAASTAGILDPLGVDMARLKSLASAAQFQSVVLDHFHAAANKEQGIAHWQAETRGMNDEFMLKLLNQMR